MEPWQTSGPGMSCKTGRGLLFGWNIWEIDLMKLVTVLVLIENAYFTLDEACDVFLRMDTFV